MDTQQPVFSLAYTSVRAKFIPGIVKLWTERAVDPSRIEWVISVDDGDAASLAAAETCTKLAGVPGGPSAVKVVVNKGSKDCNAGWNVACEATTGKVIIAVADDFLPPERWDEKLLNLEPRGWEDGEFAVHTEDGYVHTIMVLPIITRKRYDRFGYLYYPKYRSLFNDTELTEVAYRDGVVINAKHVLFEHMHPDCGKRQRDAVDLVHASRERWNASEMLFNFRKANGFPLDDGPKAVAEASKDQSAEIKFAVYMQVIKDDFCLYEVCRRMMDEGCRDFFFAIPDTYWSGEPVPDAESDTLVPVFERLIAEGASVNAKRFKVEGYRVGAESRIVVETRLRNDSLTWIRKAGFEHILIVDGDELWVPGTLDVIKPFVEQGHAAISVKMVPVIGTPGFPVDGAADVAVVYIGPKCAFRMCRTPNSTQTIIQRPLVIHFTSTRKTVEENIAKHKRSGHYDDPDYAFDDWLVNKLPNAKPGMRDAHMYTKNSIWPSVRNWHPEELAMIPKSIHPFLGMPNN